MSHTPHNQEVLKEFDKLLEESRAIEQRLSETRGRLEKPITPAWLQEFIAKTVKEGKTNGS